MRKRYESGDKYNRLTLVEQMSDRNSGAWLCQCECGAEKVVGSVYDLRRGRVISCGCAMHKRMSGLIHGGTGDELFAHWVRMRARAVYGGDGMDGRWADFSLFAEDMRPGYVQGLTLRRRDNSEPFSKDNCRWFNHGNRTLDMEQASYAVSELNRCLGGKSLKDLAQELNCDVQVLYGIKKGVTYRDVQ